ncbi:Dabb family protein [Rhodococcus erythropolis]|uniref:Dabb family protein n=1 Tax=Rhodococcus erythropolis TaxID=1833 RepID=UPI0008A2A916|nr:Dabb family protein [Rhodococcus erythropolis]MBT1258363.1 Dabb family protein [Rhodococcus erythropolis]OHF24918.1 hypothetical protein BKP30_27395 [Rhodococcus erythropolis]
MIEHTVSFSLKHLADSAEERNFIESLRSIADMPSVQRFKVNRQVSSKGPFDFQISMQFDSQEELDTYDASAAHVEYVNRRWIPEVSEWQTLDFVEI